MTGGTPRSLCRRLCRRLQARPPSRHKRPSLLDLLLRAQSQRGRLCQETGVDLLLRAQSPPPRSQLRRQRVCLLHQSIGSSTAWKQLHTGLELRGQTGRRPQPWLSQRTLGMACGQLSKLPWQWTWIWLALTQGLRQLNEDPTCRLPWQWRCTKPGTIRSLLQATSRAGCRHPQWRSRRQWSRPLGLPSSLRAQGRPNPENQNITQNINIS